jgi:trehalose synthase
VAEILAWMVPLMRDLGIDARWEVIEGDEAFFATTKALHNGLQGDPVPLDEGMVRAYDQTLERNAETLRTILEEADFVFIHDPQPAGLHSLCPRRQGPWLWRCHIDASQPHPPVWEMVRERVAGYDAAIFSLEAFAQELPGQRFVIPPSIDPLSPKNEQLADEVVSGVRGELGLSAELPLIVQISRFDRFKDPLGVVQAFVEGVPRGTAELVLAGGSADDDPEGAEVLAEVQKAASSVDGAHVLLLPPDAHRTVNALQRASSIVVQKSLREGFGLTVTEALWKGRPVIGGDTGGIRLQVQDGQTGYLVRSPAEAGARMAELLDSKERATELGEAGRVLVKERFLLTRELSQHLAAMLAARSTS